MCGSCRSLAWLQDPDNLLGKVEEGLISRRQRQKEADMEEKEQEEAKALWEEERAKLLAMRAARVVPRGELPSTLPPTCSLF
jgi:hypothetical protein